MCKKNSRVKNLARFGALAAAALAAGVYSQNDVTARVPVFSNVAATVSIMPPEGGIGTGQTRSVSSGSAKAAAREAMSSTFGRPNNIADTVRLVLNKSPEDDPTGSASVPHRTQTQREAVSGTVKYSRGAVSLKLRSESFGDAAVSLFSVNGRRVLHAQVLAGHERAFNLTKANLAAGVYMLSVKGAEGGAFTARFGHSGGKLSVNAAFDGAGVSIGAFGKSAKAQAEYGEWKVVAKSAGYYDTVFTIEPVAGNNPRLELTLRKRPSGGDLEIGPVGCSREGLINAANYYVAAVRAGDHTLMPLADKARYVENDHNANPYSGGGSGSSGGAWRVIDFGKGLWEKAHNPDYYMHFADVDSCASFSETIIFTDDPQYINSVRVKVSGDKITDVFLTVTKAGDWLFNAGNYLVYSSMEDWTELPPSKRLTRQELYNGARAYFQYFGDKTVAAPWGVPCARLEGGAYTGSQSNGTCSVGVPEPGQPGANDMPAIWNITDINHGMCVLFVNFGGADTHMFRILKDYGTSGGPGFRYIHTLTAMKQSDYR